MRVSLACGFLMLAAKWGAWLLTGSTAVLSDAAESVVHVAAVAFAAFSVRLSERPPGMRSPYGFERIAFFSVAFEAAVILAVGVAIVWTAVVKLMFGAVVHNIGIGAVISLVAALVNCALGYWLVRSGRAANSLILIADGKHVLTDSWTSFAAVAGLTLVWWTGWTPFDPLFALASALTLIVTGGALLVHAGRGLLDITDLKTAQALTAALDSLTARAGITYHGVQARDTGRRMMVTVHLLFPYALPIGKAHEIATELESELPLALGRPCELTTHLEAVEDHVEIHSRHAKAG